MVMIDPETESLWQQLTGEANVGEYTGTPLAVMARYVFPFRTAAESYPDALVLKRDTGHERPCGTNPYER